MAATFLHLQLARKPEKTALTEQHYATPVLAPLALIVSYDLFTSVICDLGQTGGSLASCLSKYQDIGQTGGSLGLLPFQISEYGSLGPLPIRISGYGSDR